MKKATIAILAFCIVILTFAGCGGSDSSAGRKSTGVDLTTYSGMTQSEAEKAGFETAKSDDTNGSAILYNSELCVSLNCENGEVTSASYYPDTTSLVSGCKFDGGKDTSFTDRYTLLKGLGLSISEKEQASNWVEKNGSVTLTLNENGIGVITIKGSEGGTFERVTVTYN